MKQAPDEIYIITASPARAEEMKQAIVLRGFDEIFCVLLPDAEAALSQSQPALVIIDPEGDAEKLLALITNIPQGAKSLILFDNFDESVFVACHDAGARDFMVKPVPEAYLVSRVINTLQEHRLEQISAQKDRVLVEMGVISTRSGLLTTNYFLKQLKQLTEEANPNTPYSLSLLIVELEGDQDLLPESSKDALIAQVGVILKDSARGLDWVGEYFMDKFAIILPQTGKRGATALGKRVLERLNGLPFNCPAGPLNLRVRVGIAEYAGCRHYEDLLNQALAQLKADTGVHANPLKLV